MTLFGQTSAFVPHPFPALPASRQLPTGAEYARRQSRVCKLESKTFLDTPGFSVPVIRDQMGTILFTGGACFSGASAVLHLLEQRDCQSL